MQQIMLHQVKKVTVGKSRTINGSSGDTFEVRSLYVTDAHGNTVLIKLFADEVGLLNIVEEE